MAAFASEVVVEGLAEVQSLKAEYNTKKKLIMEMERLNHWEAETKVKNPGYVMGSLRKSTEADKETIGHLHGEVCQVSCEVCGEIRLVNKQDAKQSRLCRNHAEEAKKARKRARQQAKNMPSREELEAQINNLNAKLAQMG